MSLTKLKDIPGYHLQQILGQDEFQGQTLTGSFHHPTATVAARLLDIIEKRYADISADLLGATRIANLRSWPMDFQDVLIPDFGDDYIMILYDHWKHTLEAQNVRCDQVASEWNLLKSSLYKNDHITAEVGPDWIEINSKYCRSCPNVLHLIDLALTLLASSAECERGFSAMKLIKTNIRSRMTADLLTHLMRVKLLSPAIEQFDPTAAINFWNAAGSRARRPLARPTAASVVDTQSDSDSSSDTSGESSDTACAYCDSD